MSTTITQLVVFGLLVFLFYRVNKQDRITEIKKKEDLHDLFRVQQDFISKQFDSALTLIKAQIELTYSDRHDEIMDRLKYVSGQIESELYTIGNRILSLETPIKIWGEAQTQNEIQKGEANRTLRRRIQEKDAVLASTRQTLKTQADKIAEQNAVLADVRSAATSALGFLTDEISAIRAWMDERGIPVTPLDKHLEILFKGKVPSLICKRINNEDALKQAIGETISHLRSASEQVSVDNPGQASPKAVNS